MRNAFELYAVGLSLPALSDELYRRGLRSKIGKQVGINRLWELLHNPFYVGIIRMKRSGEHYAGIHQPIVSKNLFEQVQAILDGKANTKAVKHDFLFRRLIACVQCKYHLIGEKQKGHTYYRCHTAACATCSVREEIADEAVRRRLQPFCFTDEERAELRLMNAALETEWTSKQSGYEHAIGLQIESINSRISRLMDAYLDGAIDRQLFEEKKVGLLMERKALEERRQEIAGGGQQITLNIQLANSHSYTAPEWCFVKAREKIKQGHYSFDE